MIRRPHYFRNVAATGIKVTSYLLQVIYFKYIVQGFFLYVVGAELL